MMAQNVCLDLLFPEERKLHFGVRCEFVQSAHRIICMHAHHVSEKNEFRVLELIKSNILSHHVLKFIEK